MNRNTIQNLMSVPFFTTQHTPYRVRYIKNKKNIRLYVVDSFYILSYEFYQLFWLNVLDKRTNYQNVI